MFVGHALLAFAIVGGVAGYLRDREAGRRLGLLAAAFATVPDVDMTYALVGLAGVEGGPLAAAGAFWAASTLVHRAVTHSVVIAPIVAVVAGAWVLHRRRTTETAATIARSIVAPPVVAAGLLIAVLVVAATLASGLLGGAVMVLFVAGAVAVAEAVVRWSSVGARPTAAVAAVGLVSHPFGDLVTGHPPALLYPLDAAVVTHRLTLAADPTLHLLGAFGIELAAIWAGVVVAASLLDRSVRDALDGRALAGVGYAAAVLVIPAPTLELSYPFVFSVLSVGMLGAVPRYRLGDRRVERPDALGAVVTGLSAVTVAWLAYGVAYLVGVPWL